MKMFTISALFLSLKVTQCWGPRPTTFRYRREWQRLDRDSLKCFPSARALPCGHSPSLFPITTGISQHQICRGWWRHAICLAFGQALCCATGAAAYPLRQPCPASPQPSGTGAGERSAACQAFFPKRCLFPKRREGEGGICAYRKDSP